MGGFVVFVEVVHICAIALLLRAVIMKSSFFMKGAILGVIKLKFPVFYY
jgi:hypothetical protein